MIDARVTDMRFYEKGKGSTAPREERVYRTTLAHQTTRYVIWELNLVHPPPDQRTDYVIEATWHRPDGSTMSPQTAESYVDTGWRNSRRGKGRGWADPGKWKVGTYRVDLSVDGKLVASEEFEIVDRPILSDDAFQAIRDSLPWASTPLSHDQTSDLTALSSMMELDADLASSIASFSWVQQGPTPENRWVLQLLDVLSEADVGLAKGLAGASWLSDDVTTDERQVLRSIALLSTEDLPLATHLATSPFLQSSLRSRDRYAIQSIRFLQDRYPDLLADMVEQDWFADGLSDDEAALVTIFGNEGTYLTLNDLRPFLADHRLESHTVMFPLRGEVLATDIQSTRGRSKQDITSIIEEAALEIETFIGIPFPQNDLILLFASCRFSSSRGSDDACNIAGVHRGSHIAVDPLLGTKDARGTLIHEVAHYYWTNWSPVKVPVWFYEGGADFLDSYVQIQLYGETLVSRQRRVEDRARWCVPQGMKSVQDVVDRLADLGREKFREFELHFCYYYYGEALFLHLYEAMGEDAFRSAWQDIYEITQTSEDRGDMTEQEIYQAFLNHVPADKLEAFKDVYKKWHGGDFVQ